MPANDTQASAAQSGRMITFYGAVVRCTHTEMVRHSRFLLLRITRSERLAAGTSCVVLSGRQSRDGHLGPGMRRHTGRSESTMCLGKSISKGGCPRPPRDQKQNDGQRIGLRTRHAFSLIVVPVQSHPDQIQEVSMHRRVHVSLVSTVGVCLLAMPGGRLVADDDWFMEFEPARAEAQKQQKDLLIDFGGSDWCAPCKWLKERILSNRKFVERAREHFILVDIDDLYRSEMPAGRKQRYQNLQKEYRVETFPSVVLATPEGKPYAWATYVPSINEPEKYWSFLEPLRKRGVAFREHLRRAQDASGGARAAALVDALAAIRADFAARYYASEVAEIRKLDPDDKSGYLGFLKARHEVEALQERLHEAKASAAAIEESNEERAELDAVAQAVDELIDGGGLRGEALQEALLLRAVLQVHAHKPGKAFESLEALLAAQSTRNRFDLGDFLPLDAKSIKTVADRIATGQRAQDDHVCQYFALHRIFEFELPDRYELSCGHGFRPLLLARGWIGEEYGKLLIRSTAELSPAERARALRKGLDDTRFWRQGALAEIQDRLLPQLEGKSANSKN